MGVKLEGFREAFDSLERAAKALDGERQVSDIALKAVEPMVQRVKDRIGTGSPWRESGRTKADIHASIDKESEVGTVKIAIGASKRNAFKVRLNEFGTSKQPAYPSLRPAHDEAIGEVSKGVVDGLLSLMGFSK
jgi:HK97 gp10 family phage protein